MSEKERIGKAVAKSLSVKTGPFATLQAAMGTVPFGRLNKIAVVPLAAVDTPGGIFSWANPEAGAIVVNRVVLDVTAPSTAACAVSIGTTATSGTTSAANLIDTASVAAAATVDNLGTPGTNGKPLQRLAPGKWVTGSKASGASAGLVGFVYISYFTV